jgi:hypothetical protein
MNKWVKLVDGCWQNLASVAQIGRLRGAENHTLYDTDGNRIGAISGRKDIEELTAAIVPAAAGSEVIVVSWNKYSLETEFHIARRAAVAWRISDLVANPVLAGEALYEKNGETFLIPHPDGTFGWPFMGVFDSIEQAVAGIKENHRETLAPPARSSEPSVDDDSKAPE